MVKYTLRQLADRLASVLTRAIPSIEYHAHEGPNREARTGAEECAQSARMLTQLYEHHAKESDVYEASEPVAWVLLRTNPPGQRGKKHVVHDRTFASQATADAAAARMSQHRRTFVVVPVHAHV